MSYLPLLMDLKGKNVLLVGAGEVALFKYKKLLEAGIGSLKVIATRISPEFRKFSSPGVIFNERPFILSDLDGCDLVIVAVNDLHKQAEIYQHCQERRIWCNCVDDIEHCDFIFPAVVRRNDIVLAVSTSGKVPGFSVYLKEYLASFLFPEIENKLQELLKLRNSLPGGKERMARIRQESKSFFDKLLEEKIK